MGTVRIEVVLITDASGGVYAVPPPPFVPWRLPDETAAALREQQEVVGYGCRLGAYQVLGRARVPLPDGVTGLDQDRDTGSSNAQR
jgi:hypothetical protein